MSLWQSLASLFMPAHAHVTSKVLMHINGVAINQDSNGRVWYIAKAAVDSDGCGSSHGDRDYQPRTSLRHAGKSLDADVDKYIVANPLVIRAVKGVVLGSQARVTNQKNGKRTDAVCGDVGPAGKVGEVSVAVARAIGINPSPVSGGDGDHAFLYEIFPGCPGFVDDVSYQLQPS